jgi:PH (Pleckstrin Homology) domain-containing protein
MTDVDRRLAPGEAVTRRAVLHWWVLSGDLAVTAFTLGVAGLIVLRNELAPATMVEVLLSAALVGGAFLLRGWWRWRRTELVVTDRRFLARVGRLRARLIDIPLDEVGIEATVPMFGRILGYGTVTVAGRDGTVEEFTRVRSPQNLCDAVRHPPRPRRLHRPPPG